VILRFLLEDNKYQADKSEKLISGADNRTLFVSDMVFAEVVYVLSSVYDFAKEDIVETLQLLLNFDSFKVNKRVLSKALHIFRENNVSFEDSYSLAKVEIKGSSSLYTFDKGIKKIAPMLVKEPK
jgi:predicted nucleic-acid-binding protein